MAEAFLKERTILELHDSVILPALSMAEQDRHNGVIDDARAAFIVQSIGEMMGLMAEYAGDEAAPPSGDIRALCLPVSGEAAAVTAGMLSQVLGRAGFPTVCWPANNSAADSVSAIAGIVNPSSDLVCICALPPFSLLKARTLNRQLQARFPDLKIVVCLWNLAGDQAAQERLSKAFSAAVTTTLGDALFQIQTLADSLRPNKASTSQESDSVSTEMAPGVL